MAMMTFAYLVLAVLLYGLYGESSDRAMHREMRARQQGVRPHSEW
jgi:hypothetical protein